MTEPHVRPQRQPMGRPLRRFHAASGADWKAVELAYADGWSVAELERKFGIDRATIYLRRKAWRTELSPEERVALAREVEDGRLLAPLPRAERGPSGRPRQARWGKNGCDWLRAELEYALGEKTADIARRMGVSANHLRIRAHREGWRAEIGAVEREEMQRRILGAEASKLAMKGEYAQAREKLRMMAAIGGVTEKVKEEADAGGNPGVQGSRIGGKGSELHRLLLKRIDEIKRQGAAGTVAQGGSGTGGGGEGVAGAGEAADVAGGAS